MSGPVRGGSPFIGRRRELRQISDAWAGGERLVTLLGPGGAGKTRLALEVARGEDGARVCHLEEAETIDDLLAAVGDVLELGVVVGATSVAIERIGRALARGAPLLVLDGLERLAGHAAPALRRWLARAPALRCLGTSRRALGLGEEVRIELPPLSDDDGAALFVAQARRARPGWAPDPAEAATIRAIVRSLDGIPLAIKLCAARATVLSPAELRDRLAHRFELLAAGPDDAVSRHRSLQAALDGSWALLAPNERDALARCAVLRGGFDVAAAEAVIAAPRALDLLQALRAHSLVRALDAAPGAPARFALYETIRAYAAERLDELGARDDAEARAAAHVRRIAAGPGGLALVREQREHLLFAIERSLHDDPAAAAGLLLAVHDALAVGERHPRHLALLTAAIDATRAEPPRLARLWVARADILLRAGRSRDAERDATSARAAVPGDPEIEIDALRLIGDIRRARGDGAAASACLEAALAGARRIGDRRREGLVRIALTGLRFAHRRFDDVDDEARAAHAIWVELGDVAQQAAALKARGVVLLELDRLAEARALLAEAAAAFRAAGHRQGEGRVVLALASVAWAEGRIDDAVACARQAVALHEAQEAHPWLEMDLGLLALIEVMRGRAEEALAHARRAAATMGSSEFVRIRAFVLAAVGTAEAACGQLGAAEASFAAARAAVAGLEPAVTQFVDVTEALVEIAQVARARAAGSPALGERALAAARARLARLEPEVLRTSHDVRAAVRLVRAALAGLDGDASLVAATAASATSRLRIGAGGRWFSPPGGGRTSVDRRAWARVLGALARQRVDHPGEGLTTDQLFAAGWPDERALQHAARNRVWVALAGLRALGLDALIHRRGGRYVLDPGVEIEVER